MNKILSIFVAIFVLSLAGGAQAAVPDGTPITDDVMAPLAAWVEQATHTKIVALPIATASGRTLKTALGLQGVRQARSMAAYLPGQIVINNVIWDPESVRSQSYILHELVHHAQLLSGKRYPCNAAKEREAYILQNQWLAEHSEERVADEDTIARLSTCPGA